MKEEIWKDIPDYPYYQASSFGRVRSLDHWVGHRYTKALKRGKLLKTRKNNWGYLNFVAAKKNISVHQAVALAFIGEKPGKGYEVNHKNCIKSDNTPENLEWITHSENIKLVTKNKNILVVIAACLCLFACRSSTPPKLSIVCILDGYGGADCVDANGNKIYKAPSELTNFWATTETDEQNFTQWCYGSGSSNAVAAGMKSIKESLR